MERIIARRKELWWMRFTFAWACIGSVYKVDCAGRN